MTPARYPRSILVAALMLVGCGGGSTPPIAGLVGKPCDIGIVPDASAGSIVTIVSPAPECPSGVCLLPADTTGAPRNPLCTASCATNVDCSHGIVGDANDPNDNRCKHGFVCMVPTTVGTFACEKMCVCRDSVIEPVGGFRTPAACL